MAPSEPRTTREACACTVVHVMEASGFGTGRHLTDLVRSTPEVRHVVVLPPRRVRRGDPPTSGTAEALARLGAEVHLVPMRRLPTHPVNALAIRRIRTVIDEIQADVVHGHAAVGGALARLAARNRDVRRVYTPHALLPSRLAMAAERYLAPLTDQFVALSPSEASHVADLGLAPPDRIHVVPNGLDLTAPRRPATVDLRARFGLQGARVVGFVGRLAPQKSPEDAVAAFARFASGRPDVHLVIVADGVLRARVEAQVVRLGLEQRVHLAGYVPDADTVLGQFDAVIQPSRWEGGPYVPLEAVRAGVPVVLSDCIGNRDVVVAGRSGEVVPVGDVAGFADALARVLDDPVHAARLAAGALRRLHEHFDLDRIAARYLELWGVERRDADIATPEAAFQEVAV